MTHTELEQHLQSVGYYAERGITRDGHIVEAQVLKQHAGRSSNDWQLFLTVGPNALREGPGAMTMWAELYELFVTPHDYRDDLDEVEIVARARLRTTGEYAEVIAKLAGWLLANGWRGRGHQLVSHEPVQAEFIVVDDAVCVLRKVPGGEGTEPIES